MNPEEINRLLKLAEENNQILLQIKKQQLIQTWIRVGYFIILFTTVYGGYLFIKPFLEKAVTVYSQILHVY